MDTLVLACQIVIALGIANVWLVRQDKATAFRGRDAKNMKEEFEVYGLPAWFMKLVGLAKLLLAAALVVAIWIPELRQPAGIGMAALMVGAVTMHAKVKDPLPKWLPALAMLAMSLVVAIYG